MEISAKRVTSNELRNNMSELTNMVQYGFDNLVILTRHGKDSIALINIERLRQLLEKEDTVDNK